MTTTSAPPETSKSRGHATDWIVAGVVVAACVGLVSFDWRGAEPPKKPVSVVAGKPIDSGPSGASAPADPKPGPTDGKPIEIRPLPITPEPADPPVDPKPGTHHGSTTPPASGDPLEGVKIEGPGPHAIGFEFLSNFTYVQPPRDADPEKKGPDQIPASIRALEGKRLIAVGYMLPTRMEDDLVVEFLLLRNPMQCCYGVAPQVNEWIVVKLPPGATGIDPEYRPIEVTGRIEVGEVMQDGWVASIYRMNDASAKIVEGD
jgi:hypothetical protein